VEIPLKRNIRLSINQNKFVRDLRFFLDSFALLDSIGAVFSSLTIPGRSLDGNMLNA
jgi:hypothetical protein